MLPTHLKKRLSLLDHEHWSLLQTLSLLTCLRILAGVLLVAADMFVFGSAMVQAHWFASLLEGSWSYVGPLAPVTIGLLMFGGIITGMSLIIGEQF